jgi:uracil-DNA glycosylase
MADLAFLKKISALQADLRACRACPNVVGPPVHGSPVASTVFLVGQAPGPREASYGKPFAYTAGRTLFRWFEEATGVDEEHFRENVYMAAVGRCFPGKAKGGADRVPDAMEIANCSKHMRKELAIVHPKLILAVGKLAIGEVLGPERLPRKSYTLTDVVGKPIRTIYHGWECDAICLPHPSGLSSWHKVEPGKTLLRAALQEVRKHPAWREQFEGYVPEKI